MMIKNFLQLPTALRTANNWILLVELTDDATEAHFILNLLLAMPQHCQTQINLNLFLHLKKYLQTFEKLLINNEVQIENSENIYYYLQKAISQPRNQLKH